MKKKERGLVQKIYIKKNDKVKKKDNKKEKKKHNKQLSRRR